MAKAIPEHVDDITDAFGSPVEPKTPSAPKIEAINLFRTISLNIILAPRTAYYLAFLAKNNLQAAAAAELAAIDVLQLTLNDLNNPAFIAQDTSALEAARNALLQLEELKNIDVTSNAFTRFDTAINEFLNSQLAASVKTPGATDLARSANEAKAALSADLALVQRLFADIQSRLPPLATGVDTLLGSSLVALVGSQIAGTVRMNIDSVIDLIQQDPKNQDASDLANLLIANRAALRSVGTKPDPTAPALSSSLKLPKGYNVTGVSDDAKATATTVASPVTLPSSAALSVQIGSTTVNVGIPQASVDLNNKACVVSKAVTYPVTVPANGDLYVVITTAGVPTNYRVQVNTAGSPASKTLAQVITAINTTLGGAGAATEFIKPGTSRLLIYATSGNSISISTHYVTDPGSGYVVSNNTTHALLGFQAGQTGQSGATPMNLLFDAINLQFTSIVTTTQASTGAITLQAKSNNTDMVVSGTAASTLGISGTFKPSSTSIKLTGLVNNKLVTEVDPRPVIEVGDALTSTTGSSTISKLTNRRVSLSTGLPFFKGTVTVTSQLATVYKQLQPVATNLAASASNGDRAMAAFEQTLAAIMAQPTAAQLSAATNALATLRTYVYTLQTSLNAIALPATTGANEQQLVKLSIDALTNRKFDRAIDLLLSCNFETFMALDLNHASYATNVMSASEKFASDHINFPRNTDPQELKPSNRGSSRR